MSNEQPHLAPAAPASRAVTDDETNLAITLRKLGSKVNDTHYDPDLGCTQREFVTFMADAVAAQARALAEARTAFDIIDGLLLPDNLDGTTYRSNVRAAQAKAAEMLAALTEPQHGNG